MELYTIESLSTLMGVDKDPDFWSPEAECRTTAASSEVFMEHGLKVTDWANSEQGMDN